MTYRAEIKFLKDNTLDQMDVEANSEEEARSYIAAEIFPAQYIITAIRELP
jgi:hypothetical protein